MSGNWTDPEPFKKTDEILTKIWKALRQYCEYKFFSRTSFFNHCFGSRCENERQLDRPWTAQENRWNWTDAEPFKKTDEILTEVFGVQLMNYKFKLLLALNEFLLLSFFNGPGFFFQVMTFVCYECRVFSSIEFYQLLKNCKRWILQRLDLSHPDFFSFSHGIQSAPQQAPRRSAFELTSTTLSGWAERIRTSSS